MIKVWDPGVRLFHGFLAAATLMSLWTGFLGPRNLLNVHVASGAAIAALLVFRLIWGCLGSTYARFSSFLFDPAATLSYARNRAAGRGQRFLGHNPLGSVMIFALLAALAALAIGGVLALGGVDKQGPLAFAVTYRFGLISLSIHRLVAFGLLALIGAHLAGVVFESIAGDRGLLAAMISGWKAVTAEDHLAVAATARPVSAAIVLLVALSGGVYAIAALSARAALGVPTEALAPNYVRECGGCHMPYPASLGTKARWDALMADLADHFGEDASLEPKARADILAYLTENSAEKWDTRAAHQLGPPNREDPLRITATLAWRQAHRHIPEAIFKSKSVRSKSNCGACHTDATSGRFDPQDIRLPESASQ